MIGHRGSGESYEYSARARDKIRVWCIAGMSAVVVHLRNMIMMGSLFPLVVVSFEEIPVPLMDAWPLVQYTSQRNNYFQTLVEQWKVYVSRQAGCGVPLILTEININTPAVGLPIRYLHIPPFFLGLTPAQ